MTAYYNEFDPGAAAWLRELIRRGLIADGEVDERSILEVQPDDLRGYTQCHFFAGIGGWSYALRLAGWPDDKPVWTGSPPCQPFSSAGQQKGKDDERHLAPHFASLVAAGRPPILFGEQVASSAVFGKAAKRIGGAADGEPEWAWIDDLCGRLEAAHYAVGASDLPAAGIGAPHIRQRTFFGAVRLVYPDCAGQQAERLGPLGIWSGHEVVVPSAVGGLADATERGRLAGFGHSDKGREQLDTEGRGETSGMADAECSERGPISVHGLRQADGAQGGGAAAEPARDRNDGGLADTGHLPWRNGTKPEGSELNAAARRGRRVDRLADPASAGLEGQRERGSVAAGDGEPGRVGVGPQSGGVGGLADADRGQRGRVADGEGCQPDGAQAGWQQGDGQLERSRADGGLADAKCEGLEGRRSTERGELWPDGQIGTCGAGNLSDDERPSADHGGWADADWLFCRDGKWRPVEPGTFPLAHGVSARVVRLRGYGNAIVPQAAAIFIKAFVESLTD